MIDVAIAVLPWVSLVVATFAALSATRSYIRVRTSLNHQKISQLNSEIACMERFRGYAARVERGEVLEPKEALDYTLALILIHHANPAEACHSLAVVAPFVFGPHRRARSEEVS